MQTLGNYVEEYAKLFGKTTQDNKYWPSVTIATLCCCPPGDTDKQGALEVREQFSELERSHSKRKSKNTEFMMEVETVSTGM